MTKTLVSLLSLIKPLRQTFTTYRVQPVVCACSLINRVVISADRRYHRTVELPARPPSSPTPTDDSDIDFKTKLVSSLNFERTEEALPFLKLPIKILVHISKVTKNDESKGFCKNRVYYIAQRLNVDPLEVSERVSKRTFIYSLSFDWLKSSLDVLLEMGVSPERILRDMWVLKYHNLTIREKLQGIKDLGIDVMCPWMVRCSEDILKRFITISQETKSILGDTKSTHMYLADRLNTSPEAVNDMCDRLPALRTIRVTKLKTFLDFLQSKGFTAEEIAAKPRILTASQKTIELRLQNLRKLGLKNPNLNVLCRSRRDFKKYCQCIETGSKESK